MVDLKVSNRKLEDRAKRLIVHATGTDPDTAAEYLTRADGHAKLAILMLESGLDREEAKALLTRCEDHLGRAICQAREEGGGA